MHYFGSTCQSDAPNSNCSQGLPLKTGQINDTSNHTAVPTKGHGAKASLEVRVSPAGRSPGGAARTHGAGQHIDTPSVDLVGVRFHGIVLDDLAEEGRHRAGQGGVGLGLGLDGLGFGERGSQKPICQAECR